MWLHQLRILYRNILRFKSTFIINLLGLSAGLACAILIFMWVNDELHVDKYFSNQSQLYALRGIHQQSNNITTTENTPALLGESIVKDVPGIAAYTTVIPPQVLPPYTFGYENESIKGEMGYADKHFFRVFPYKMLYGDPTTALSDINKMVISESIAKRFFKDPAAAIGKTLSWEHERPFIVAGVFEDMPSNATDHYEFIIPTEVYYSLPSSYINWDNHNGRTYLELEKGVDPAAFQVKIKDYIKTKLPSSLVTLRLVPYAERYLYDHYENGVVVGGRIEYVRLFSIIAIFIVVIACINFMNLTTAKASRRMKEIGVKKAVGASKQSLVFQYLGESMFMAFLSLLFALVIVYCCLPTFNNITGKSLTFAFSWQLVGVLLGITCITGLLAGSYPALYLSNFNPVIVLKGKFISGFGEMWARKGLVVFQFTLSVILIVAVMVVYKQIEFIQHKHLGYNRDNVLYVKAEGRVKKDINPFLEQVRRIPGITYAGGSSGSLIGQYGSTIGISWPGKGADETIKFAQQGVTYDVTEALEMKIIEGRTFSRAFATDTTGVVLNETAVKAMRLQQPLGTKITFWGEEKTVIGVVKNFNYETLHQDVQPWIFRYDDQRPGIVLFKIQAGQEKATIARLEQFYKTYNPGFSFDYRFLDSDFAAQYTSETQVGMLSRYFAALAVFISCLGLFGLSAFTAERRMKEIGIRKILGANSSSIILLLSSEFTKLVLIAVCIALPLSYWFVKNWLNEFAYQISLSPIYFLIAGVLAIIITWLTVGFQSWKAARINPTKSLKI